MDINAERFYYQVERQLPTIISLKFDLKALIKPGKGLETVIKFLLSFFLITFSSEVRVLRNFVKDLFLKLGSIDFTFDKSVFFFFSLFMLIITTIHQNQC